MSQVIEFVISLKDTLGPFINFFLGMATGMILFTAIFVHFLVRGKNMNVDEIKRPTINVEEQVLIDLIKSKQKYFKRSFKTTSEGVAKLTFNLSFELVEEIAKYFFPDSKYPMLELNINELLSLSHYITDRIDDLLDKPIIKNTRNLQVTKIMQMYDKKKQVEETKLVKAVKKLHIPKVMKYGGAALNAFNPVYWFRKIVINTSLTAMTKKVCIVMIGIVGEETTKVYSKALFKEEVDLKLVEQELQQLLEEGIDEDE
jgi:hypothetical protein